MRSALVPRMMAAWTVTRMKARTNRTIEDFMLELGKERGARAAAREGRRRERGGKGLEELDLGEKGNAGQHGRRFIRPSTAWTDSLTRMARSRREGVGRVFRTGSCPRPRSNKRALSDPRYGPLLYPCAAVRAKIKARLLAALRCAVARRGRWT